MQRCLCAIFVCLLASVGWAAAVQDEARQAATQDARQRLREQVMQIRLDEHYTVQSLLQRLRQPDALDTAIQSAEVAKGGVRWLDERNCQVMLRIEGAKVADALASAATRAADPKVDPRWVKQLTHPWRERDFTATGTNGSASAATTKPRVEASLPDQPPAWVFGLADAEAVAQSGASRLHTARLAEQQASLVLRQRVEALEIYPRVSLASVAKKSPAIARAVDTALQSARVYKTEYRADGSVLVRMSLNLRVLWSELDRAR